MEQDKKLNLILKLVGLLVLVLLLWRYLAPRFAGDITTSPIAFSIGSVGIHWYGIIIALALVLSYVYFIKPKAKELNINEDQLSTFVLLLVLAGIIGARLGYIIQNVRYYFSSPLQLFAIWNGGMSIHGALIAGIAVVILWSRKVKVDAWKLLDVLAPATLFAMAIGRLGNFMNQELFGKPTDIAWKMYIATTNRPIELVGFEYFHPVFLYEMILDFVLLVILLWLSRKRVRPATVFVAFVGGYSIIRFIVEFWRYNPVYYFWNLSLAQIVSWALIILSIVGILFLYRDKLRK